MTTRRSQGRRKFHINPGPLKIVPAAYRKAWEDLAKEVALDVPPGFRRKWTRAETARVILAEPEESYDDLASELQRTPGAIRYRRMAMIHLLREEHGAHERVEQYRSDPKVHHKHHDYYQVAELLRELGIYNMPVAQQLELAQELQQPSRGWRGDGTSAALAGHGSVSQLRREFRQLALDAKVRRNGDSAATGSGDTEISSVDP